MTREWKPGELALLRLRPKISGQSYASGEEVWAVGIRDNVGTWAVGTAIERRAGHEDVLDARPLVLIDPESDDDLRRLHEAIGVSGYHRGAMPTAAALLSLRAALRSLTAPPKPDEPQGLGAVIEDADGALWISVTNRGADDRWQPNNYRSADLRKNWRGIAAVKVLSEGVA